MTARTYTPEATAALVAAAQNAILTLEGFRAQLAEALLPFTAEPPTPASDPNDPDLNLTPCAGCRCPESCIANDDCARR